MSDLTVGEIRLFLEGIEALNVNLKRVTRGVVLAGLLKGDRGVKDAWKQSGDLMNRIEEEEQG